MQHLNGKGCGVRQSTRGREGYGADALSGLLGLAISQVSGLPRLSERVAHHHLDQKRPSGSRMVLNWQSHYPGFSSPPGKRMPGPCGFGSWFAAFEYAIWWLQARSVLDSEYLIESWGAGEGYIDNVQFLLSILELCLWVALDERGSLFI